VREDDGTDRRRRAAQLEAKFRAELYTRLRAKLKPPGWALLAATLFDSLEHESKKRLCRIRGFEAPKLPYGSSHDYDAVGKTIDSLGPDELVAFVNDCIYVRELEVHTWSDAKPELLLAAAQAHDIDAKAVRREVTPKKKAKASKRKKAA
jgi:hypothetical protein